MSARVLVVCCHPNPASFTHAVFARVLSGLRAAGCSPDPLDLYAEGFAPVLVVDATRRRRDLDNLAVGPCLVENPDRKDRSQP